jgi:hypothetical protein
MTVTTAVRDGSGGVRVATSVLTVKTSTREEMRYTVVLAVHGHRREKGPRWTCCC